MLKQITLPVKNIRDTSIEAYHDLVRHPRELNGRYLEMALEEIGEPSTDLEIACFLGKKDPNYVRPRRHELSNPKYFDPPVLVDYGKRKCRVSGKMAYQWFFSRGYVLE